MAEQHYELCDINTKLLWEKGFFLILGPSGTGKTTTIKTVLEQPRRYMGLSEEGANLWVFPGASLDLQSELEAVLDRDVFKTVKFISERVGKCSELRETLTKNKDTPKKTTCIILDDYMTYTPEDALFVRELLRHHKRHQRLCLVVATHQLRKDRTGIMYDLVDHADRIIFCRDTKNLANLKSLAVRLEVPKASRLALNAEFISKKKKEGREFGLCVFEPGRRLIIPDYHALEVGKDQKRIYAYGESSTIFILRSKTAMPVLFQNSDAVKRRR